MSQILKTKDYDLFKKHESNRAIDLVNLAKIITSLEFHNLLEFRPILVDSEMRIIDGQHRLEAAKKLGVEIFYQISESENSEDIILLNANQKNWSTNDYIDYYISKGNENYKKYVEYANKNDIKTSELYKFFGNHRGNISKSVKNGKFIFPSEEVINNLTEKLDKCNNIIQMLKKYLITQKNIPNSANVRYSIISLLENPQLDYDTLINKITYKAESLRPCTSRQAYYCMFRDIYNYRNPNPID